MGVRQHEREDERVGHVLEDPPAASTWTREDVVEKGSSKEGRPMCVQRRLTRSAGAKPAGAKISSPVAWIAGRREIDDLKPIDKAVRGTVSESPGRNESEPACNPEN